MNLGCAFINIMAVEMVMINVGRGGDCNCDDGGSLLIVYW